MKLKILLFLAIGTMLYSCMTGRPIEKIKPENNPTYKVEYLFELDGCKVYKFYDSGHYVYFTNCRGDVTSIAKDSTEIRIENRIIETR